LVRGMVTGVVVGVVVVVVCVWFGLVGERGV
jgi:hypothetical protein